MCLAIPGQIVEMTDVDRQLARVDVGGVRRVVNVGLLTNDVAPIVPGDWVLIHVGFAMSRIDEGEARTTLELLEAMGAAYQNEISDLKASAIE